MEFFKRLFKKDAVNNFLDNMSNNSVEDILKEFAQLNETNKMKRLITLGDSGNPKYYDLLTYVILNEQSQDLKFTALKRIHLFKEHPNIGEMFRTLEEQFDTKRLEPYYSMALSRVGIISTTELEKRINRS